MGFTRWAFLSLVLWVLLMLVRVESWWLERMEASMVYVFLKKQNLDSGWLEARLLLRIWCQYVVGPSLEQELGLRSKETLSEENGPTMMLVLLDQQLGLIRRNRWIKE